jgi:hypothetical protein
MSMRIWNTVLERRHLRDLLLYTGQLIILRAQQEEDNSSSSSSSDSSDSSSSGSFGSNNSIGTTSTIDYCIRQTLQFGRKIYTPTFDATIDWHCQKVVEDFSEIFCQSNFCFRPMHLRLLFDLLWPRMRPLLHGQQTRIVTQHGYVCKYETGMLILFYRMSFPRRLSPDMEQVFCMRKSALSSIISTFREVLHTVSLPYLSTPGLFFNRFDYYGSLIDAKTNGAITTVWAFIDGTLRRTCRPTYCQKAAYSGHKRCHGIKFQSVIAPDGLIVDLYGPIAGSRHDSYMLAESGLLPKLRELMPEGEAIYSIFGDPAYPQSAYLLGSFTNTIANSDEAEWNTVLSKVRICVEWGFKEIAMQWSYLDFKKQMKIFEAPIAQYYIVGGFLCNCRNTIYGSQTQEYYNAKALSLEEYINLVN